MAIRVRGRKDETAATAINSVDESANVIASRGATPEITCDIAVDINHAAQNPAPNPMIMRTNTCFIIDRMTDPGVAPTASRTPISCFRSPTVSAIIPLMPDAVIHNAITAKALRSIAVVRRNASHSLRTCIIGRTSAITALGSMSCAIHLSRGSSSGEVCGLRMTRLIAAWGASARDPYISSTGS